MFSYGLSVIFTLSLGLSFGEILLRPSNTEAAVGERVQLKCTIDDLTGNFQVEWQHVPVESTSPNTINRNDVITGRCGSRCSIEGQHASGEYNLVIRNVSLEDAGKYTCIDVQHSTRAEAQLIVFDSYPSPQSCSTDAAADGVVGLNSCEIQSDVVQLSCRMSYRGLWKPTMDWLPSNTGHRGLTVGGMSNFTVNAADEITDRNFTCYVKYPDWGAESKFRWTTSIQVFSNVTRAVEVTDGQLQTVDCGFMTQHQCRYKWTLVRVGHQEISSHSVLNLKNLQSGVYICSAECTVRGTLCTVHPVQVNLTHSNEYATTPELTPGAVATLVVVGLVIIIVVVVIILVVRSRQRLLSSSEKSEQTKESSKEFQTATEAKVPLVEDDKIIKLEDTSLPTEDEGRAETFEEKKPDLLAEVSVPETILEENLTEDRHRSDAEKIKERAEKQHARSIANSEAGSEPDLGSFVIVNVNEDSLEERIKYQFPR